MYTRIGRSRLLCRHHRLPWSYAPLSVTWPLLTTCLLCRTSKVGCTSVLIKSVHILEAGLWHFTSVGHELHTHLIASHKNILRSLSWKWLKLPSSFGTRPWRLVDTDFPEGLSTTMFIAVRKEWLGLTCRGRKQVPWKPQQLFAIRDGVIQEEFNLHQLQKQNLKYSKIVCPPLNKGRTTFTDAALFITWLYEPINEAADLSSQQQTSHLSSPIGVVFVVILRHYLVARRLWVIFRPVRKIAQSN
jgi:hypothetical protein